MIDGVRHIGIVVDNVEDSLEFYRDYFGFEIEKDVYEEGEFIEQILNKSGAVLRTIKLRSPVSEVMLELIDFVKGEKVSTYSDLNYIGLTHFALTIKNIEEKYKIMIKNGVNFLSAPKSSPDGYAKVVFCQAPEGTYIEIVELLGESDL